MAFPISQLAFYNNLLRIHFIITRGIEITYAKSLEFVQNGFPDHDTQVGFHRYAYSLIAIYESHHRAEEDVTFPYLQQRLPGLRIEPLIEQHKKMQPHADEMKTSIEKLLGSAPHAAALNQLAEDCNHFRILWQMHTRAEEEYFAYNSLSAVELTPEEQQEITQQTTKYSQKLCTPPQWVVPFIMYNLPPKERQLMAKVMPSEVTTVLIPMIWKDEWAPMKPFLMD